MIIQLSVGIVTVLISLIGSWFVSSSVAKNKLTRKYEWDKYHDAEVWCDDFIRLIREMQANYVYKKEVMNKDWYHTGMWMPGDDLDNYGERLLKHVAQRPVIIFNLLEGPESETGITDKTGRLALICGILANQHLLLEGVDAYELLEDCENDLNNLSEEIIENVLELRNTDLQEDFQE